MRIWTPEDVQWLTENHACNTNAYLAEQLGTSVASIADKASKLGLRKAADFARGVAAREVFQEKVQANCWTPEQVADLVRLYATTPNSILCARLDKARSSIHRKAMSLGLKRAPKSESWIAPNVKLVSSVSKVKVKVKNGIKYTTGITPGPRYAPTESYIGAISGTWRRV